jgi:tetratricopeptide (TPR) repeat protein
MYRIVFLLLLTLLTTSGFAQQQIVSTATDYITHNQFARADHYLDSILKLNPKTVDALMMKGNVLLNKAWNNGSKSHFNTEKAESIFDSSVIDQSFFIPIIPIDTSVLIDRYWKQCLQIDPDRTDIKKGLCSLYSLSLRTAELERQLIQMQPLITENEDNAFLYAEYARNLKARGRFDDAMQVYALIAGMFPDLAGIRCDMANEYFYAGDFNKALAYLDSTLSKKEIDQTSFINAAAVYSTMGYYDQAYNTFKRYSEKDTLVEADFYRGLMMFANMDTGFYEQLRRFIDHANPESYYDEVQLAQKLLPYGRVPFTLDDFETVAYNPKIARYYRVLILQRGVRQFSGQCVPLFLLGSFDCTIKNYEAAVQLLEPDDDCRLMSTEQMELWTLTTGFAWYKKGDRQKAVFYFERLFYSHNSFNQQAAKYFEAKINWDAGKKEEAKKLFAEVAASKTPTKYSWLSKGYLGR